MNEKRTIEATQTHPEESTPGSSTTTGFLSETRVFDADHNELKERLKINLLQQSVLDKYLLSGFKMIQKKSRELRQIAQVLKLFLEHGAKWKDGVLLENQMTPHHLICQSNGDNHELLDLIITCFNRTLINSKSHDGSTALLYAVQKANCKCAKSLIANGAKVNLEDNSREFYCSLCSAQTTPVVGLANNKCPVVETIKRLHPASEYSSIIMTDMFDLLLDSGVNVNKTNTIEYAIQQNNVQCVKKLIEKGAWLDKRDHLGLYTWAEVARMGSVELLKCLFDHGINKNCTDLEGQSLLSYVVESGKVEAIRYLLELGVTLTSCTTETREISCNHCGKNRLLIDINEEEIIKSPHMVACEDNMLPVVRLLEEYGNKNFKTMNTLTCAVIHRSYEVVEYLLDKYKYPLNVEYARKRDDDIDYDNILGESCRHSSAPVIELLLVHGADPNQTVCEDKCPTALITAIAHQHKKVVARFIQCGVDINRRSYDETYGSVLPFEASVLYNNACAAEKLLIAGCACGVFSLDNDHKFKKNVRPELENLIKEWNVQKNNVIPLKIQCRRVILKHLCPKTVDKIDNSCGTIVKYLSICELVEIVEDCNKSQGS